MALAGKKIYIACFIALAGLFLVVLSFVRHQALISALSAFVTMLFVACVAVMEKRRPAA